MLTSKSITMISWNKEQLEKSQEMLAKTWEQKEKVTEYEKGDEVILKMIVISAMVIVSMVTFILAIKGNDDDK